MEGKRNYVKLNYQLLPRATSLIRRIFYENWRVSNHKWRNNYDQGKLFITNKGEEIYSNASSRHKQLLESGNVNVWDMKLLIKVLQKVDFGLEQSNKPQETPKLKQFLVIRKEIVKIPNCWIDEEKFNSIWDDLTDLMIQFGDEPKILNELKLNRSFSYGEMPDETPDYMNILRAKGFKEVANAFYKVGKLTEAIETYTEGIYLENITNDDLSTLYSNRAGVYLSTAEINLYSHIDSLTLAKYDAKSALELRPTWFRGHHRLACVHIVRERYQKAIKHLEIAMILVPNNSDIKDELTRCKLKLREQIFSNDIYPEKKPENNAEMAEEISKQFGTPMSEEFFLSMEERLKKLGDPRPLVWQAHRYLVGCNIEQNSTRAAELYAKAAQQGNPEGLYNLALLHRDGRGVKKDLRLYIKLLKQATMKSNVLNGNRNVGVAESEFALGRAHENGIGVSLDINEAINWYKKACEHGNKHAANTLACLYFNGKGVDKNEKKAVQYWKLAALRHNVLAMQSLANYYLENIRDVDKALSWHHKAVANGNLMAKSVSSQFELRVKAVKAEVDIIQTTDEEKTVYRNSIVDKKNNIDKNIVNRSLNLLNLDVSVLEEYISRGSVTALSLKKCMAHFNKAKSLVQHKAAFSSVIITELANCIRICEKVISWDVDSESIVIGIISRALRLTLIDEKSELDKDARICYLTLQKIALHEKLMFVEDSIVKYSDEVWFYIVLCNVLGIINENEKGITESLKSLHRFPCNCDLLFILASHMQALKVYSRNSQKTIQVFQQFIAIAPNDHRKVPQAYYSIALEYLLCDGNIRQEKTMRMVFRYFKMGLQAEKLQLPFYLPYVCEKKSYLEKIPNLQSLVATIIPGSDEMADDGNYELDKPMDPHRVLIIIEHREKLAKLRNALEEGPIVKKIQIYNIKLVEEMQNITIRDMDPSKGIIYERFAILLVVIEEPIWGFTGIHMIVEDENGDAERLCVYNFPEEEDVGSKLGYGCEITVLNPYYKIFNDGKGLLQVDDVNNIIFKTGQNFGRCRFCGKPGSTVKCDKCYQVVYCSENCQLNDWNILKHQLICLKE